MQEGLDAEGLYRVSGDKALTSELLLAFEGGTHAALLRGDGAHGDPLLLASVVKLWLRQQRPPLLQCGDVHVRCVEIGAAATRSLGAEAEAQHVAALRDCVGRLPACPRCEGGSQLE